MIKNKELPPNETRYNDLVGVISINLADHNFNLLVAKLMSYDASRFEAVALRVFIENTPLVTVYALDKTKPLKKTKLPVHKFKKEISLQELFSNFNQLNFTVTSGDYRVEDMEVVNK